MLLASSYPFSYVLWTMFIFFLWIIWFWLLFTVFVDVFRRHDIHGGEYALADLRDHPAVPWRLHLHHHAERRDDSAQSRPRQSPASPVRLVRPRDCERRQRKRRPRSRTPSSCSTRARSPRTSSTRSSRRRWPPEAWSSSNRYSEHHEQGASCSMLVLLTLAAGVVLDARQLGDERLDRDSGRGRGHDRDRDARARSPPTRWSWLR